MASERWKRTKKAIYNISYSDPTPFERMCLLLWNEWIISSEVVIGRMAEQLDN